MDLKKDTLIIDKGELAITRVLDDKKSNIYHIYKKQGNSISNKCWQN